MKAVETSLELLKNVVFIRGCLTEKDFFQLVELMFQGFIDFITGVRIITPQSDLGFHFLESSSESCEYFFLLLGGRKKLRCELFVEMFELRLDIRHHFTSAPG